MFPREPALACRPSGDCAVGVAARKRSIVLTHLAATLVAANAAETPAAPTAASETLVPQDYAGTFRTHDACVARGSYMYDRGMINEFCCEHQGFAGYDLFVTYNY